MELGLNEACQAIRLQWDHDVNVVVAVGEYHRHWFMPLMACTLPMWRVGPNDWVIGDMVMASLLLSDEEVAKSVKASVRPGAPAWPVIRAMMKPHPRHMQLVSY